MHPTVLSHLIRNCRSDNTIRSYQTTLLAFIGFLKAKGKHHIETTTRDDISAYVEYEQDRGLCVNSVNTQSRLVYSFLQFLADRDLLGHSRIKTTERYCKVSNLKVQRDYHKAIERVMRRHGMAEKDLTECQR